MPQQGTVKYFNSTQGTGFITPDGATTDIFIVIAEVERAGIDRINTGQRLEFEVNEDPRSGRQSAVNLKLIT
ncbi:hypothetical protein ABW20_dc0102251 [Dactylellina cionopaga]|nr:hypothetical protein ABW20_dc0102251 [Dactylellina cionopaga]